jgi:hypothetical protein
LKHRIIPRHFARDDPYNEGLRERILVRGTLPSVNRYFFGRGIAPRRKKPFGGSSLGEKT